MTKASKYSEINPVGFVFQWKKEMNFQRDEFIFHFKCFVCNIFLSYVFTFYFFHFVIVVCPLACYHNQNTKKKMMEKK